MRVQFDGMLYSRKYRIHEHVCQAMELTQLGVLSSRELLVIPTALTCPVLCGQSRFTRICFLIQVDGGGTGGCAGQELQLGHQESLQSSDAWRVHG